MELKVGDKLQYTSVSGMYYKQGGIYKVIEVDNEGMHISNETGNAKWLMLSQIVSLFKRIDEKQADQSESQTRVAKVKLTQGQAEAIKWLIETGWDVEEIINDHYRPWVEESEALNDLSAADLARALLIGYDVEQTAAEKLVEYYQECKEQAQQALMRDERHRHDINAARVQAINTTVSLLGIGVKGINVK